MMKRLLGALLFLAAACARPPITDVVTIEPARDDAAVLVTVQTSFDAAPANEQMIARVEAARAAALSSTDAWSVRFARLDPEDERLTLEKHRGTLESITRAVRIPLDDLQRVFSDANITVDVVHGEGWTELHFYPGSGSRATREQQKQFEGELASWSAAVARYFTAVDHLYSYLRDAPGRDRYLFAAIFSDQDAVVTEDEQPLVDGVVEAMAEIAEQMDAKEGRSATLAEEADLIFNPFPARVVIRTPGDVISSEGFTSKDGALTIEPVDLMGAINALEGRWIYPDPLTLLLRDKAPTAAEIAEMPRRSRPVTSSTEIAQALRDQLTRPKTYLIRWRS